MYETIMVTIYGIAALIKNKILSIIILLAGIIYLILSNYFTVDVLQSIDINSLMILLGTYGLSKMLIKTNIINYLINTIVEKVTTYKKLIIGLSILTFIISGIINNYVLAVFLIPYIEEIIKKNNVKAPLLMESIIVSSILGSMSTLIGSTENIIISSHLKMNFLDFFFYDNRIGIYIISLALFLIELFIINLSIKDEEFMGNIEEVEIKNKFNIYLFLAMIFLLIVSSVLKIKYLSGILTLLCLFIGLYKNKKIEKLDYTSIVLYALMFLYISLFKGMSFISLPIFIKSSGLIYTIFFIVSLIMSLIFNPVFVFYFLCLFIPNIVINTNLISMPLIYITYFGLLLGIFKEKKVTNYQIIICMLLCSYLIVAFLYF